MPSYCRFHFAIYFTLSYGLYFTLSYGLFSFRLFSVIEKNNFAILCYLKRIALLIHFHIK